MKNSGYAKRLCVAKGWLCVAYCGGYVLPTGMAMLAMWCGYGAVKCGYEGAMKGAVQSARMFWKVPH